MRGFQFLGIPPKGELYIPHFNKRIHMQFPISRDPPEGGTYVYPVNWPLGAAQFPISRDPPEGGT